jgi:hypothetical protein
MPVAQGSMMTLIEERLAPCDGLNNYNVFLARMDLELQGSAQFTFSVTHSMMPVGEFSVSVPSHGQSMDRMAAEAHDALIDIFRQLTFRAEKARLIHLKNAARQPPPAPPVQIEPEALDEFLVEPRGDQGEE